MIEIERTDQEREELVKQWIKDYWLYVVGVIGLAIGLVYGLNNYRNSKIQALHQTAAAVSNIETDLNADNLEKALENTAKIQADQPATSFSTIATLELAKKLFEENKYDEAIKQYEWLIQKSGDVSIRDMARLRKARAQSNAKQLEAAVDTLNGFESQAYFVEATLLKGDILMANSQFDAAQKAYESIQDEAENINPQVIQSRLDLLDIKRQKSS